MILTGSEISKHIQAGNIKIDPFSRRRLNPNSYNLRLHPVVATYKDPVLDMKKKLALDFIEIPETGLTLKPGQLYLGRTEEYTETHGLVPMLEGRSSVGRLGMFVHVTAGFGDVGFCGYWTLEMFCVSPLKVYPHIEICQIFFHTLQGDVQPYRSTKYQHNKGLQPSMMYKDFEQEIQPNREQRSQAAKKMLLRD
jgi:dCTP deaminase